MSSVLVLAVDRYIYTRDDMYPHAYFHTSACIHYRSQQKEYSPTNLNNFVKTSYLRLYVVS